MAEQDQKQTLPSISTLVQETQSDSRMSINGLLSPNSSTPDRTEHDPNHRNNDADDMSLDGHDPEAILAAEALGSMASTPATTTPQPSGIISRVQNIPLFHSVIGMYEESKANSRFVNYAGGVVENSVKAVAAPVYDRIGGQKIDGWVSGLLEKVIPAGTPNAESTSPLEVGVNGGISTSKPALTPTTSSDSSVVTSPSSSSSTSSSSSVSSPSQLTHRGRARSSSRSSSPHRHTLSSSSNTAFHPYHSSHGTSLQTLTTRSRWQQLMLDATSTAGSTAAVVSEESMKCLRYCLSWLQYAQQHIDQQITILRDFLLSLLYNPSSTNPNTQQVALPSTASQTLAQIKKEVIETLRKVVEVVSKYAGATLPEQARKSVRAFILSLPGRWASLNEARTGGSPSPAASPMLGAYSNPSTPTTPTFPRDSHGQPTVAQMHESGVKILNLAVESVDMLKGVSNVFAETIERAEGWLARLKLVGVSGLGGASAGASDMSNFEDPVLPPLRNHQPKQRPPRVNTRAQTASSPKYVSSSSSSDNEMESASEEEESKRMPMVKKKKRSSQKKKAAALEDSGIDADGIGMEMDL